MTRLAVIAFSVMSILQSTGWYTDESKEHIELYSFTGVGEVQIVAESVEGAVAVNLSVYEIDESNIVRKRSLGKFRWDTETMCAKAVCVDVVRVPVGMARGVGVYIEVLGYEHE